MAAPATLKELVSFALAVKDAYIAAPVHPLTLGDERRSIEQIILGQARNRLVFAAFPFAPPGLLDRLADEPDIHAKRRVAANPATGAGTLRRLYDGPCDAPTHRSLALHRNLPAELLSKLADGASAEIREALCQNPMTPPAALKHIAVDLSKNEASTLARHPSADGDLLAILWNRQEPAIQAEVAAHPNCPTHIQRFAEASGDPLIRRKLAQNPMLGDEVLLRLLSDPISGVRAAATRNLSDVGPIDANDPSTQVRRAQASHVGLPDEIATRLSTDSDQWVRRWLARNPAVSGSILDRLAADPEPEVRRAVGRNPACPSKLMAQLARDDHGWVRAAIAFRSDITPTTLKSLSDDRDVDVMAGLGRNPGSPSELLRRIAGSGDADVRRSVILNQNASGDVLETLLDDPYPLNRAILAIHPNLPTAEAWGLTADPEPEVRYRAMARRVRELAASHKPKRVRPVKRPVRRTEETRSGATEAYVGR